jgi:hypothetical protein
MVATLSHLHVNHLAHQEFQHSPLQQQGSAKKGSRLTVQVCQRSTTKTGGWTI